MEEPRRIETMLTPSETYFHLLRGSIRNKLGRMGEKTEDCDERRLSPFLFERTDDTYLGLEENGALMVAYRIPSDITIVIEFFNYPGGCSDSQLEFDIAQFYPKASCFNYMCTNLPTTRVLMSTEQEQCEVPFVIAYPYCGEERCRSLLQKFPWNALDHALNKDRHIDDIQTCMDKICIHMPELYNFVVNTCPSQENLRTCAVVFE